MRAGMLACGLWRPAGAGAEYSQPVNRHRGRMDRDRTAGHSKTIWEDGVNSAVKTASKSVRGIRSVNVQDQSAVVEKGKVNEYR